MEHRRRTGQLRLKNPTGWFAAGREVAAALEILSGDAFKPYVYLCLNAERHTGRFAGKPDDAARLFEGDQQRAQKAWDELFHHHIGVQREADVEICDRFWPCEKTAVAPSDPAVVSYGEQVRRIMLRPACVRASFSAADERLARNFHARRVPLKAIERAVWLGCVRKYVALLNGYTLMLITSLGYFSAILEEVTGTDVCMCNWTGRECP